MKKIAFAVVIAVVAASPALAAKKKAVAAEPDVVALNDPGYRFVRDSMPIYWPTALTALYYGSGANNTAAATTTHHHKKKH